VETQRSHRASAFGARTGSEYGIEGGREVAVAIVDQEAGSDLGPDLGLLELPGQVPRLLGGPGSARVLAAGSEQDAPAGQLQPGKETVLPPPPPLRTRRDSFRIIGLKHLLPLGMSCRTGRTVRGFRRLWRENIRRIRDLATHLGRDGGGAARRNTRATWERKGLRPRERGRASGLAGSPPKTDGPPASYRRHPFQLR
jgi:hypothetical protein